jgi:preprotein translocase subunit SecB
MADEPAQNPQAQNGKQLLLQRIYIKDMSFESPKAPQVFASNVQAVTQLNIASNNRAIDQDHVEVTLTLTVESKHENETMFLIEIVQAGIFTIKGYSDQERAVLLGTFCPGTLYPFAREIVADTAQRGGFPQLLLQPINFDAVYARALQDRQTQAVAQAGGAAQAFEPPAKGGGQAPSETPKPGSGETH